MVVSLERKISAKILRPASDLVDFRRKACTVSIEVCMESRAEAPPAIVGDRQIQLGEAQAAERSAVVPYQLMPIQSSAPILNPPGLDGRSDLRS